MKSGRIVVVTLITLLCLAVITVGGFLLLKKFAPKAKKKEQEVTVPVVEVLVVKKADAPLPLSSEGLVAARRETVLTAEVGGRIVFVDPRFEVGGRFETGEVILRVDEVNYRAAVAQAQADLADARLMLKQETARGEQAARDWQKIGGGKPASEMVLRVPYLESAKARVASAQAMVEKALEDLDRTRIRAPFDCRVREATLDLGATVMPGTRLGMVYGTEGFEVRLPFSLTDFAVLDEKARIVLSAKLGGETLEWPGRIVRREGEIDRASLSAYIIAEILENEEAPEQFRLPPPGMFLQARVSGVSLDGVIEIPRSAVRGRDRIAVVNDEGQLEFRTLTIVRSNADSVYVTGGVEDGERVIMTKMEMPVEGMTLEVAEPTE
ncbi:MAG: efflux RND transporter periplasmic adaptor subunit [Verrucomicrobiaceae bacterium]